MTTNPTDWEIDFDERFVMNISEGMLKGHRAIKNKPTEIKDFIRKELSLTKEKTREEMHHEYATELTAREEIGYLRGKEAGVREGREEERTRIIQAVEGLQMDISIDTLYDIISEKRPMNEAYITPRLTPPQEHRVEPNKYPNLL